MENMIGISSCSTVSDAIYKERISKHSNNNKSNLNTLAIKYADE